MTRLGLPVPDGFTITTAACVHAMHSGGDWPEGLQEQIDAALAALEERCGRTLGDEAAPLLVSVRSGAAVSMPGMMETILNLGLNDVAAAALAEETGDARFAYDSYRRLLQMFGDVVEGVASHVFEDALTRRKCERGAQARHRPHGRRPARALHRVQAALPRGLRRGLPAGSARAAAARDRRRVPLVGRAARARLPPRARHLRRPRHGRQHLPDGVRQPRRELRHGRLLLPRPVDRRARAVRRVPAERPGRGRRRGHPHARADRAHARADARGLRRARRHGRAPRAASPRGAGHRVHGRAGPPLHAADAHGQAHRAGRAAHRARVRRRGRDHAGRGRPAHRPGPARASAAPAPRRLGGRSSRSRAASAPRRAPPSARRCSTPTPRPRAARRARPSSSCAGRRRPTTSTA